MQELRELVEKMLDYISKNNYSDLHIVSGTTVRIRNKIGELENVEEFGVFPESKVFGVIKILLTIKDLEYFLKEKEVDFSFKSANGDRFRGNCFFDSNGYSIALRRIMSKIPTMDELGLGEKIKEICERTKGLILLTGPTGSGKSTNLASMIDFINKNFCKRIITLEEPIEFSFQDKKSLISQREVGNHTNNYENAIKSILREDPDVVVIGEMRNAETIRTALTLAETGHIVFSTLHTNDSVQTLDRIIDAFPEGQQDQVRLQLSQTLIGIISQILVPKVDNNSRIPAREILILNDAIRNSIIEKRNNQIYNILEVGKKEGMILMDKYLLSLYLKGFISKEVLLAYSKDKRNMQIMIEE